MIILVTLAMLAIPTKKIIAQPSDHPITQDTVQVEQAAAIANPPLTPRQLVEREFTDAPVMIKIARAENNAFNPKAKNPNSSAKGLFQILDGTWKSYDCTGSAYDSQDNIDCARKIYSESGTAPWNESKASWS